MRRMLLLLTLLVTVPFSYGHVKWFSPVVDTTLHPLSPAEAIFSPLFLGLAVFSLLLLSGAALIEHRILLRKASLFAFIERVENAFAGNVSIILRVGMALYFAVIALYFYNSPVILTLELKTQDPWVIPLQLAIATLVLFRKTASVAAAGLTVLYFHAILSYGWFHMLDYLFFLGIVAFLVIEVFYGPKKLNLSLAALRLTTGASFLWVSVEKWVYPAWTSEIFRHQLQSILMGFAPETVTVIAGFVEFFLAFVLLFGIISSQLAALVLMALLTAAIPVAGLVDGIGHLPVLAVLLVLTSTRNRLNYPKHYMTLKETSSYHLNFLTGLTGLMGSYCLLHHLGLGMTNFQIHQEGCFIPGALAAWLIYRLMKKAKWLFWQSSFESFVYASPVQVMARFNRKIVEKCEKMPAKSGDW